MGELQPNPQPIKIEIDGEEFELYPHNTAGFMHPNELNHYDCVVHAGETPLILFRHNIEDFDDLISAMEVMHFKVEDVEEPNATIIEMYERFKPGKQIELFSDDSGDLTPRQEKKVAYLRHLLVNDHLTPDDFSGDGDLYI